MKKNFFMAVWTIMMAICTVLTSCNSSYDFEDEGKDAPAPITIKEVGEISCDVVSVEFGGTGVVKNITRSATISTWSTDGTFSARINCVKKFKNTPDSVVQYAGTASLEAKGVNRPFYLASLDSLKNPTISQPYLEDGKTYWLLSFNDRVQWGLEETSEFPETVSAYSVKQEKNLEFPTCKDAFTNVKLVATDTLDMERDSANWHKYDIVQTLEATLESGNKGNFQVTYPVWVWTGGQTPDFPEKAPEIVCYREKDKGLTYINPTTNNSWIIIDIFYSDGSTKEFGKVSVDLENEISAPERLIKTVEDFSWASEKPQLYAEVADGQPYEKKTNIFVQPLSQTFVVKTNKGSQPYILKKEGRAYWIDPMGETHTFLEPYYEAEDKGWEKSNLGALDLFERILLTNESEFTLNGHSISAKAEIELRKMKDETVEIIDYEYSPLTSEESGIRLITPIARYFTYRTQYAVTNTGKKTKMGEVGTYVGARIDVPAEQTIPVTDWNITDGNMALYNAVREGSRKDTISTGVFTIQSWKRQACTKTNKSQCKFEIVYDGTVTFLDDFKNEVEFIALNPSVTDKGGVETLSDMGSSADLERKAMTSTINVAVVNENADYPASVIFTKTIEKEELVGEPKVETTLTPMGNGEWSSKITVSWTQKLAGPKNASATQVLNWGIKGEAKSVKILSEAKADWSKLNDGSSWSGATTSNPQSGVALSTYTKSLSDIYSTLTDGFTATKQTAKFTVEILGKSYTYDMAAPTGMTFSHKAASLVDAKRTETKNGTTYNVYDHSGTITATVNSSVGSQAQDATDLKEIWVEKQPEKEELVGEPKVTTSLTPMGNGEWSSKITVSWTQKLAGPKNASATQVLNWGLKGEAKSVKILSEAKADWNRLNDGNSWSGATTSNPQSGVALSTYTKSLSDIYSSLTDSYTATKQTAKYTVEILGKSYTYDMAAPSSMTFSHKAASLDDAHRTETQNGKTYNVYDHSGTITATVNSSVGSQAQDATDLKEIWVEKAEEIIPEDPEKGEPIGLASANGYTAGGRVYIPGQGNKPGTFYKAFVVNYTKGKEIWYTKTPNIKAGDYVRGKFYKYGESYHGQVFTEKFKINSAIWRDNAWEPALVTMDKTGWTYQGIGATPFKVICDQNAACIEANRNFDSSNTAANNPFLTYTWTLKDKVLTVVDNAGNTVRIK